MEVIDAPDVTYPPRDVTLTLSTTPLTSLSSLHNGLYSVRCYKSIPPPPRQLQTLTFSQILCAIFLPPLGVFLERGCGADLLINVCPLSLLLLPLTHSLPRSSSRFWVIFPESSMVSAFLFPVPLLSHSSPTALYIILKY